MMGRSDEDLAKIERMTREMAEGQIVTLRDAIEHLEEKLRTRRRELAMWESILRRTPK